jgi:hypothetical protein
MFTRNDPIADQDGKLNVGKEIPENEVKKAKLKEKKRGIVANVTETRVIINSGGFGEWIPYDATKHSHLKRGDPIEY